MCCWARNKREASFADHRNAVDEGCVWEIALALGGEKESERLNFRYLRGVVLLGP
jgi:hypothetical protein